MRPAMRRRLLILSLFLPAAGAAAFWWTLPPVVAIAIATRGPALEAIHATGEVEPAGQGGDAPRQLQLITEPDAQDIARIRIGQRVLLRAEAFPGQALPAAVTQILPAENTAPGSHRLRVALPDDTPLRSGMRVEADIVLREEQAAVLVPPAALHDGHVFVVEKELVRRRAVMAGVQGAGAVEIRAGLGAGDSVVLDPPAELADGDHVRLRAGGAVAGPARR
jgi:hypothetical protein